MCTCTFIKKIHFIELKYYYQVKFFILMLRISTFSLELFTKDYSKLLFRFKLTRIIFLSDFRFSILLETRNLFHLFIDIQDIIQLFFSTSNCFLFSRKRFESIFLFNVQSISLDPDSIPSLSTHR